MSQWTHNTTLDSPLSSSVCVCLHTCTFAPPLISVLLSHLQPPCIVKMSTIEEGAQGHAGVSHSPPLSSPSLLSPPPLLLALLLLCVVDTSWHVAKSPGHLSALLSCPLHGATDGSLVARGSLLPACHFSRCLTVKRQEPASEPTALR